MNHKFSTIVSILCCIAIFINLFGLPSAANEGIQVILNGTVLTFDVLPQVINDRTMVPMRKIFEALGATVEWYDEAQVVVGTKGDTVIQLKIDSTIMIKNKSIINLDVPPKIVDNRTLVPVRAVAESFDADVSWDEAAQTVFITQKENPTSSAAPDITVEKTREVFFTSIKVPNDDTVYPLFMRDVALVSDNGICYAAQTTLYRVLTMARYGYRIIDVGDHPKFPGFEKVSDIPLGISGFGVSGPEQTGSLYDTNQMSKKYLYSAEGKAGYTPAIWYNSRCYLKITDVLTYFEIPYESVVYDANKDNIIIQFKESSELHQVEDTN